MDVLVVSTLYYLHVTVHSGLIGQEAWLSQRDRIDALYKLKSCHLLHNCTKNPICEDLK